MWNRLKRNGMRISDELIACYVEGTATTEERDFVRNYLCRHPEEYERIVCLMDNDKIDYLGEHLEITDNSIPMDETSFSDIAYSSAAFAPEQNKLFMPKHKSILSKASELYDRLSKMSNELYLI